MMPNLNAHFAAFLKNLDVPADVITYINAAKKRVKERLCQSRTAFGPAEAGGPAKVTPRFFTQGSWGYGTLNYPYETPPQQIDVDFGVYLPVSCIEDLRPSLAAKDFFFKVDAILGRLAADNQWRLDRSKETCTRVILNDLVHLDIPLYSIPDLEFNRMPLQDENPGSLPAPAGSGIVPDDDSVDAWSDLPTDRVLLALRSGEWHESDPRMIHRWFSREVQAKSEQLRRVSRYLKAWRDKLWRTGGPSFIFLMVICANTFKRTIERDDIALMNVLRSFPDSLSAPVIIPNGSGEDITKKQKPEDIRILRKEAVRFHQDLSEAIGSSAPLDGSIVNHLGSRFRERHSPGRLEKME